MDCSQTSQPYRVRRRFINERSELVELFDGNAIAALRHAELPAPPEAPWPRSARSIASLCSDGTRTE